MTTVLLSTAYLAPVEYYTKLLAYDRILVEQYDHYGKQTYRNRCTIAGRISDHGNWRHLHWNALESAYNHTPFFEYYKDEFRPFYEQKYEFLLDFNEALCSLVCSLIDLAPHIGRTTDYVAIPTDADDFRERIHPKKDFRTEDPGFAPHPYYQVFQDRLGFLPNLSIADLLFNMGPESLLVLQACQEPGGMPRNKDITALC